MISKSKNDYMSEGAIAGSCACWSLSMILPVLQEDMKVTTVQRAPRTAMIPKVTSLRHGKTPLFWQ
jgi:hypothetical protein